MERECPQFALGVTAPDMEDFELSAAVLPLTSTENIVSLSARDGLPAAYEPESAGSRHLEANLTWLGENGAAVLAVFQHIEWAEQMISDFTQRSPRHRALLHSAFRHLRWRGTWTAAEPLIRAHVEELLQRVLEDKPLQPATRAEVLMGLSELSGRAVLTPEAVALFESLFSEIWPRVRACEDRIGREPWPGRTHELLHEWRQHLADPSRVLQRQGDLYD